MDGGATQGQPLLLGVWQKGVVAKDVAHGSHC